MRQIIAYTASSVDACVAGPGDGIDWLYQDSESISTGFAYNEFLSSVDTILMGRKTYEVVLKLAADFPYKTKRNYVYTRDPNYKGNEWVTVVNTSVAEHVKQLREEEGTGKIWLMGGGQLNSLLLQAKLLDILVLTVHPVIVGSDSVKLFEGSSVPFCKLQLLGTNCMANGLVQIVYKCLHD